MTFDSPGTALQWVELCLSMIATLTFGAGGWALLSNLRRSSPGRQRVPVRSARRLGVGLRRSQIQHYRTVAGQVVQDAEALLASAGRICNVDQYEARTMIPLVSEARKMGELLLAKRKRWHLITAPKTEYLVELAILELIELETRLKAIPRAFVSFDDVVAGRFE